MCLVRVDNEVVYCSVKLQNRTETDEIERGKPHKLNRDQCAEIRAFMR